MNNFVNRMWRAARMETALYEEVESDPSAMGQAIGVVLISSAAAGIGSLAGSGGLGFITGILGALIGWFIWAYLTYLIGTKLLPTAQTRADYGELLRTIGFSSSPGIIRILGIIPGIRGVVFLVAGVWMLAAMVVAVRQALDYKSTWRAIGVCVIGWVIQLAISALFLALFGGPAPSPGA